MLMLEFIFFFIYAILQIYVQFCFDLQINVLKSFFAFATLSVLLIVKIFYNYSKITSPSLQMKFFALVIFFAKTKRF